MLPLKFLNILEEFLRHGALPLKKPLGALPEDPERSFGRHSALPEEECWASWRAPPELPSRSWSSGRRRAFPQDHWGILGEFWVRSLKIPEEFLASRRAP